MNINFPPEIIATLFVKLCQPKREWKATKNLFFGFYEYVLSTFQRINIENPIVVFSNISRNRQFVEKINRDYRNADLQISDSHIDQICFLDIMSPCFLNFEKFRLKTLK